MSRLYSILIGGSDPQLARLGENESDRNLSGNFERSVPVGGGHNIVSFSRQDLAKPAQFLCIIVNNEYVFFHQIGGEAPSRG